MDGHPDIYQARRTAIKLSTKPRIIVAMPVGGKPVVDVFEDLDGNKVANERGFRAQGLVPIQFVMAHMNWTPPLNVSIGYMVKMNMLSSHARQVMTMEAIRAEAEYIFYVDDDTLIPPLGLYTLYNFMEQNPHAGAVSGVYTTRENPNEPLIYKEHGKGCAWDFEMGPNAVPEVIFGAGAGCLLARVSAIKDTMDKNPGVAIWADEKDMPSEGKSGIMWGHDIRFCRMLNLAGHPVYVDGRIMCGHHDIKTNTTYYVPETAPGFKKARDRQQNINTEQYWDQIYTREGANSWRKYPEMFQHVADNVDHCASVLELGCGVGILGSKLTAEKQVAWHGYDLSQVAVDACAVRFLRATKCDLRQLTVDQCKGYDTVVMSETLEHMGRSDGVQLLRTLAESSATKIIITVPNNCMGPEEVPEHTALFNEAYMRELLSEVGLETAAQFSVADDLHLLCVIERE